MRRIERNLPLRNALLAILWAAACSAQSITVTQPTSGATLTDWWGNSFTVSLTSLPNVERVCYTVDAYPARFPGRGAVANSFGCSNVSPYSYLVNSYNWNAGPHQVYATAYDALGSALATSSAVSFSVTNPFPCNWAAPFNMSVSTGTALTSPWAGNVGISVTPSGTNAGTDGFAYAVYVDGIQVRGGLTGSTFNDVIPTAPFSDGQHVIAVTAQDCGATSNCNNTVGTGCYNVFQALGQVGEWSRVVTFANGHTNVSGWEVRESSHDVFLAPANTYTETPTLVYNDGTTGAGITFDFQVANTGVATVSAASGASTTITAVAGGNTRLTTMAETVTCSDLAIDGAMAGGNQVSSGCYPFSAIQNSTFNPWMLKVTGGAGCAPGLYTVVFNGGTNGLVIPSPGSSGSTCSFVTGPTRNSWVFVNGTNTMPHFGNDGQIHTAYSPGVSQFIFSPFQSSGTMFYQDQSYTPGPGTDTQNSGWNSITTELTSSSGQGSQGSDPVTFAFEPPMNNPGGWVSWQNSLITHTVAAGIAACPKCMFMADGTNSFHDAAQYNFTTTDNPNPNTGLTGCTNWTVAVQGVGPCLTDMYQGLGSRFWGVSVFDEGAYTIAPLQGPLQPSATGTAQNWLKNVIADGGGNCTVNANVGSSPGNTWSINQNTFFLIHGSSTAALNTSAGTILRGTSVSNSQFTFPCAGVSAGTHDASSDPGLTIEPLPVAWYGSGYNHYWSLAQYKDLASNYANPTPISNSMQALSNPIAVRGWSTSLAGQCLTAPFTGHNVCNFGDYADVYDTTGVPYIISRPSTHSLITDNASEAIGNNLAIWARSLYGYYDPGRPLVLKPEQIFNTYDLNYPTKIPISSMSGNTIITSANHRIVNIVPGLTRAVITGSSNASCNTNYYVIGAPTPTSLNVVLAATTFTATASTGTLVWNNPASGAPSSEAISSITASGTIAPNYGDPVSYAGAADNTVMRQRGRTFTISGTGTAFDSNTFFMSVDNFDLAQNSAGAASSTFYYRQVPSCSGTGGTLNILYDNFDIRGRNAGWEGTLGHYTSPQHAVVSVMEIPILRAAAGRPYYQGPSPMGWQPHFINPATGPVQAGWTGANGAMPNAFTEDSSGIRSQWQNASHPRWENAGSAEMWHAGSMAALLIERNQDLILQPAINGPDYGYELDCGAHSGSNGAILMCVNGMDGVSETRTFNLSPYLRSGQQIFRYVISGNGAWIKLTTLPAGTASDTLALAPGDTVHYAFPATSAGRVMQPTISGRLADVPNASKIVIRYGYDPYFLDSGNLTVDCGTGNCTVPLDLGVGQPGQHPYRIIYEGANGAVLAVGDVQTW